MGIFLDVQKAFDCVNHELLLKKLENSGIHGVSNNLLKSFLSGRTQRVKCYEYSSEDLKEPTVDKLYNEANKILNTV